MKGIDTSGYIWKLYISLLYCVNKVAKLILRDPLEIISVRDLLLSNVINWTQC